MNDTGQFNCNSHAYQKLVSMTTAVLQLTDYSVEAADNGYIAQMIMLDQSAAFDCVNSKILIDKMKLYGFSKETCNWFSSYMEGRTQYVSVGAAKSSKVCQEYPKGVYWDRFYI